MVQLVHFFDKGIVLTMAYPSCVKYGTRLERGLKRSSLPAHCKAVQFMFESKQLIWLIS